MAYRHYSQGVRVYNPGFGTDVASEPFPPAPPQGFTTDPNAYTIPPGSTPGPTDLVAQPAPDTTKPSVPFLPPPAPTPLVPMAPMNTAPTPGFFDSVKSKLTSPGPLGFAWGWWVAGGVALYFYRSHSGASASVTPNARRKKRSRR